MSPRATATTTLSIQDIRRGYRRCPQTTVGEARRPGLRRERASARPSQGPLFRRPFSTAAGCACPARHARRGASLKTADTTEPSLLRPAAGVSGRRGSTVTVETCLRSLIPGIIRRQVRKAKAIRHELVGHELVRDQRSEVVPPRDHPSRRVEESRGASTPGGRSACGRRRRLLRWPRWRGATACGTAQQSRSTATARATQSEGQLAGLTADQIARRAIADLAAVSSVHIAGSAGQDGQTAFLDLTAPRRSAQTCPPRPAAGHRRK